ncbi:hypothetical protein BASA81_000208 [Batrachochytrium salamandrivorans]|nr:hypothetical protein BASA81_000208 [Batrachochytrium salamandrivorans]
MRNWAMATQTRMISPVSFASGITNVKELRGGEDTTCVLFQDETVQCLGSNSDGQFGTGSLTPSSSLALVVRLAVSSLPPTMPNTMPPTKLPTPATTQSPTKEPTTRAPTTSPTLTPTKEPTFVPSHSPTKEPTTLAPTLMPTGSPTNTPTLPTPQPTRRPTRVGETDTTGGAQPITVGLTSALLGLTALLL